MESDLFVDAEILLNTKLEDLSNVCKTNKHFAQICKSNEFWQEKYKRAGLILLNTFLTLKEYLADFQTCLNILLVAKNLLSVLKVDFGGFYANLAFNLRNASDVAVSEVDVEQLRLLNIQHRLKDSQYARRVAEMNIDLLPNPPEDNPNYSFTLFTGMNGGLFFDQQLQNFGLAMSYDIEKDEGEIIIPLSENSALTILYVLLYKEYNFHFVMG